MRYFAPIFLFAIALNLGLFRGALAQTPCADNIACTCTSDGTVQKHNEVSSAVECENACIVDVLYQQENGGSGEGTYDFACIDVNGAVESASGSVSSVSGTSKSPSGLTEPLRESIIPTLNVQIPGLDFTDAVKGDPGTGTIESNLIGLYVKAVYAYLIGAGATIAVTLLMIGGVQYATAGGNKGQVEKAKERIKNAIIGVIILLLVYNIAFLIDPRTVQFSSLVIQRIDPIKYVGESGEAAAPFVFDGVTPPAGVICNQSSDVYAIATSLQGKVTYRMGGDGTSGPFPGDKYTDPSGRPYSEYCPEGQLCFDCSHFVAYVAFCAGLDGPTGLTASLFASAEKVLTFSAGPETTVNGIALKPGDLLGWKAIIEGESGHVFMYIGNGKVTDAHGGSGRLPGNAVQAKSVSYVFNNYVKADHGLYVIRR